MKQAWSEEKKNRTKKQVRTFLYSLQKTRAMNPVSREQSAFY